MSTVHAKIVYPLDSSMPWGEGLTPEPVLAHARIRTLAALRDISHIFTGVDTDWFIGPQSNPILDVIVTFSNFKDGEEVFTNDPGLVATIGNFFVAYLQEYWTSSQRSLSIPHAPFEEYF